MNYSIVKAQMRKCEISNVKCEKSNMKGGWSLLPNVQSLFKHIVFKDVVYLRAR